MQMLKQTRVCRVEKGEGEGSKSFQNGEKWESNEKQQGDRCRSKKGGKNSSRIDEEELCDNRCTE